MRLPDEERKMFMFYGDAAYERGVRAHGMKTAFDKPSVIPELVRIGLGEFKKFKGETGSYMGNPRFAGSVGMREDQTMTDHGVEYPVLLSDKLVGKRGLDFPDLFATDPKAVEKGIGLVPEEFEDFGFEKR